jgi:hypothetical protein
MGFSEPLMGNIDSSSASTAPDRFKIEAYGIQFSRQSVIATAFSTAC